jgi:hypothetical protein
MTPLENYQALMQTIRNRFDLVDLLKVNDLSSFSINETAAFHGRKIIEAIAFSSLVAVDHGLNEVPRDAKGLWNAEKIFENLGRKNILSLPSPTAIRYPNVSEMHLNTQLVLDGIPERRIDLVELKSMYKRMHKWMHEMNPYTYGGYEAFIRDNSRVLWRDLSRLYLFLETHFVAIRGSGFICVLRDSQDGLTKVKAMAKISE